MPICTPYRPPRRRQLRARRTGGVAIAVAVVALAAMLTLPAAFGPPHPTGEQRPFAQRIQLKKDGAAVLREHRLAVLSPSADTFRAVV